MCDIETLVSVVGSGQGWELCSRVHWQFLLCPLGYAFSEDGEYFAYGLSASGSDWVTIKFMKVDGAKELPDVLERVKFSCMAWTHDGKGMFYNAYPQQDGKSDGRLRLQMKHLFHEMKCVATWLREEARPYVEVAWSGTMFPWRTLCPFLLLCNTSCRNFVVHNNDHLFLLVSLQIGQAVLGVAEFCRYLWVAASQLNMSGASVKLHVASHPLAGQPGLLCKTGLQERAKRHDLLAAWAYSWNITSLLSFGWSKSQGHSRVGNKYSKLWKIGAIFIAVSILHRCSLSPKRVMEKMDFFF